MRQTRNAAQAMAERLPSQFAPQGSFTGNGGSFCVRCHQHRTPDDGNKSEYEGGEHHHNDRSPTGTFTSDSSVTCKMLGCHDKQYPCLSNDDPIELSIAHLIPLSRSDRVFNPFIPYVIDSRQFLVFRIEFNGLKL